MFGFFFLEFGGNEYGLIFDLMDLLIEEERVEFGEFLLFFLSK